MPSATVPEVGQIAAAAVSGFGIWQVVSLFQGTAPKLSELRGGTESDKKLRTDLNDAAMLSGAVAFLAGGLASYAAKSFLPLMIVAAVWGILLISHYMVLKGEAV